MDFGSRRVWIHGIVGITCLSLVACAQSGGSVLSRRTTVGSLKAGMSHLEFENNDLKQKLADLKSDNRQVENRLVQEESANGELKARLDNARTLISDRGGNTGSFDKLTDTSSAPASAEPSRTIPAGRSTRPKRKAPFAQIGRLKEPILDSDSEPALELPPEPKLRIDSDDQSRLGDPNVWLPISRGASESSRRR